MHASVSQPVVNALLGRASARGGDRSLVHHGKAQRRACLKRRDTRPRIGGHPNLDQPITRLDDVDHGHTTHAGGVLCVGQRTATTMFASAISALRKCLTSSNDAAAQSRASTSRITDAALHQQVHRVMSDLALSTPSRQATAAIDRSAPLKVTGKLKTAIDSMVWYGLTRQAAAEHAGLKEPSLYAAFLKPHVKTYYLGQLEVLRTSERARNIHTLAEVRDQQTNQMARVQAVKVLEQISDESADRRPAQPFGGVVVVINSPQPVTIDQPSSSVRSSSDG
jgi:hypothetical protein